MLFQTSKTFVRLRNTNGNIFDEFRELSDPAPTTDSQCTGSQTTNGLLKNWLWTLNLTFKLTYDCKRVCLDVVCCLTHITEVKTVQNSNTDPDSLTQYLFSSVSSGVSDSNTAMTRVHAQTHTYIGQPASIGKAKNKHLLACNCTRWKCAQVWPKRVHTQQMLHHNVCVHWRRRIWRMNTNTHSLSCSIIWLHRAH